MSKKLIALVPTAVLVNGERQVVQPGEPLPELGEHDARELLAAGAAQDPAQVAAAEKAAAQEAAEAAAEIEAARQRVQAEAASTAPAPAPKAGKAGK